MSRHFSSRPRTVVSAPAATDSFSPTNSPAAKGIRRAAVLLIAIGFVGAAGAAQLTLSWTDNADNETGFYVERSTNGSSYAQVATVGANMESYTDTGLLDSTAYWYRVCAYNAAGNSSYSNIASATTPPAQSNQAPTISNLANRTINEDSNTGAIAFTVGDAETPAGSLTVTGSSSNTALIPHGNIVFGGSGSNRTVTVTPAANQSGAATITVSVNDGSLNSSDTFTVTVTGINDAPVIGNISNRTIPEDGSTGAIAFSVSDVETPAGSLTVSGSSSNTAVVPHGNIVFGGSGSNRTVTVTPAANQSGAATITVIVSDGQLTAADTFSITVNAVNDAPTISNITNRSVDENSSTGAIAFTIGDVETSAGSLAVTATSSNTELIPNSNLLLGGSGSNRTITVVPATGQSGSAVISVMVSDGALSAADTFTVMVNAVNDAPTISNLANRTINEDSNTGAIAFTVGDAETPAGSLALTGSSSNTTLVPNNNIVFSGNGASRTVTATPAANQSGSAVITVTVSDGLLSANATFTLTVSAVNDAPTISNLTSRTINENSTTGAIAFTVGDAETSANSLTVTGSSSNTTLVPSGNIVFGGSGSNRTVTVTPASNQSGNTIITVNVSDGALSAADTFTVTVTGVNTTPTVSNLANQTINEDSNTGAIAFTVGDAETPTSGLTVTGSSSNTTLVPNSNIVFNGSGANRTVTVTPAANQSGSAVITVTVGDGALSASDTFNVAVNSVNDAPTISSLSDRTVDVGESTGAITFAVSDVETSASNLTLTGSSSNLTLIPNANIVFGGSGANRTVAVTPATNQNGTTNITISVSDGALSASTTFTMTVNPSSSPSFTYSLPHGGTVTMTAQDIGTVGNAGTTSYDDASGAITVNAGGENIWGNADGFHFVWHQMSGDFSVMARVDSLTQSNAWAKAGVMIRESLQPGSIQALASATAANGVIFYRRLSGNATTTTTTGSSTSTPVWVRLDRVGSDISAHYSANGTDWTSYGNDTVDFSGTVYVGLAVAARTTTTTTTAVFSGYDVATIAPPPPANSAPTISSISDQTTDAGTNTGAIGFSVADAETPATSLAVTASSANQTLVPNGNIILGGTNANRTITVTPGGGQSGTTTITVTVSDGTDSASEVFTVTVNAAPPEPAYVGPRYFFGNFGSGQTGTFGLLAREDDTGLFVASVTGQPEPIEAISFPISDSGSFTFSVSGLGTVTGQIDGDFVSGSISGAGLTFSGTMEVVDGSTESLAGFYDGMAVNSSDGRVLLLVGPNGRAFVLNVLAGSHAATLAPVAGDGSLSASLANGTALAVTVDPISGSLAGTITSNSQPYTLSGNREDVPAAERLINTSVRAHVEQGAGIMIAGFVVQGTGTKQVLIRGIGPTLANLGVPGTLADPMLKVFRQSDPAGSPPIAENNDWEIGNDPTAIAAISRQVFAFGLPAGSKDAALLLDLPAGAYTAHVSGVDNTIGAALVEVYDTGSTADTARLANISLRGQVGAGEDSVIAGFVVNGNAPKRLLIRAVGPELAKFGVPGTSTDPVLNIFQRTGGVENMIATNNDWGSDAAVVSAVGKKVGAFTLTPGSTSAAMTIWLEPGIYTAQATSNDASLGIALVEVYEVP